MPASSKRVATVTARRVPKNASAASSKPYLRFHHSHELRAKTLELLDTIETAESAAAHSDQLSELVLELTSAGMDEYFIQSLKAAKVDFVVQQSASLGLSGVQKVIGTVARNVLSRMDDRQILSVCGSVRKFMA